MHSRSFAIAVATSFALVGSDVALARDSWAIPTEAAVEARVALRPTRAGKGASGVARVTSTKNKANQDVLTFEITTRGVAPGKHALNAHENGGDFDFTSCDDDARCVGRSYNPSSRPHHGPLALKKFGASACHFVGDGCVLNRHIGDLGNIVVGEGETSTWTFTDAYTTLKPGAENSLVGRSLVIRAGEDDFETEQDDGNAGPIILYGAIEVK